MRTATYLILWTPLLLLSCLCVLYNGWVVINVLLTRRKQPSLIPIVGGLLGNMAFAWAPWGTLNRLWWLPLVADLGSLPYLVLVVGFVATEWVRRGSR